MSVPRLRRTVALTPEVGRAGPGRRRTRAGGDPTHRVAGRRVEGDQVDVGAEGAGEVGELGGVAGRSLTPSISAHSKLRRRPLAAR